MRFYVSAHVLDAPYHIDHSYSYYIPEHLEGELRCGSIITVPFGRSDRRTYAVVCGISDTCEYKNVKPVISVTDGRYALTEELLKLCFFIKEQVLCTVGEAVRCMLPSSLFQKTEQILLPTDKSPDSSLDSPERSIYDEILTLGSCSEKKLCARFGEDCPGILHKLIKKGLVRREYTIRDNTNTVYTSYVSLAADEACARRCAEHHPNAEIKLRSEKMRELLSCVIKNGRCERDALLEECGATSVQLKSLIEKGLLKQEKEESYRNPYKDIIIDESKKNILSDRQREAYLTLCSLYHEQGPHAALLYGVTGSGKTRVMKAMIDEVTRDGRSVIVLVPEIALTPQTVGLFCSFYGERVAVLHSALSAGEKLDAHKRIREGKVDVVIGTRSAVFAPLSNLGMIIIDEEQEHTYKSDSDPKYHARDVARFRCAHTDSLMLLCSATPSVESFYKAKCGTYTLVCLRERYGSAALPEIKLCDMRRELKASHLSPVSRELIHEIEKAKSRDEQAIVFLNRRGYNSFVNCRECGEALCCPHCSVSLTAHRGEDGADTLKCHYCGYSAPVPRLCPSCNSDKLIRMGVGTQKASEELKLYLPDAKIMRMDADTTATKHAYDTLLSSFRDKKADILIGTQMVAKGHDFPDVTVVGVMGADAALANDDYRAGERAFSLITQVVGRAGRASKPGVALIQTFKPESEIMELCCRGDYEEFYSKEIELRRSYIWPPFCDIVLLTLTASNESDLARCTATLSEKFREEAQKLSSDVPIIAYGPFEAPIYKLNEKYRMRMVVKTKLGKHTRALFSSLLCEFSRGGGGEVVLSVDFNPTSI